MKKNKLQVPSASLALSASTRLHPTEQRMQTVKSVDSRPIEVKMPTRDKTKSTSELKLKLKRFGIT